VSRARGRGSLADATGDAAAARGEQRGFGIPIREAPGEIVIGATLPLSGRFTSMAGSFDRLCYSWAKLVNSQGGIYVKAYDKKLPVKFIIYDDKSEPAESAKFYERLAK
jgi:ABC-type branched-subunit amino acid transport system substrate-binding protein